MQIYEVEAGGLKDGMYRRWRCWISTWKNSCGMEKQESEDQKQKPGGPTDSSPPSKSCLSCNEEALCTTHCEIQCLHSKVALNGGETNT